MQNAQHLEVVIMSMEGNKRIGKSTTLNAMMHVAERGLVGWSIASPRVFEQFVARDGLKAVTSVRKQH